MRIISKFHDYYDTAAGLGIDKTLIYKRANEKFKLANRVGYLEEGMKPIDPYLKYLTLDNWKARKGAWWHRLPIDNFSRITKDTPYHRSRQMREEIAGFVIGFCGREYLGIEYQPIDKDKDGIKSEPEYFYGEDLIKFFETYQTKPKTNPEQDQLKRKLKELVEFINQIHGKERIEKFVEYGVPIYLEQVGYLEKNPVLGAYDFFKVFDSFAAFQEVSMFMGGVLGKGDPKIIVIDEKYRQVQAGLDKWSFRNPDPPKRKQKNYHK